jgi:hypothetical protein
MAHASAGNARMDSAVSAPPRTTLGRLRSEAGTTMIETAVACGLLLVTLAGLMTMGAVATMHTENQGHLAPRTTEYAQDKMEQLLGLAYGDVATDTVVFPASGAGGSGLAIGGSSNTAAPANKYVDWLGSDGGLLGGGTAQPAGWFYERVWQVSCAAAACTDNPATGIKQVTVTVTVRSSVGGFMLAKSSIVALKASQF